MKLSKRCLNAGVARVTSKIEEEVSFRTEADHPAAMSGKKGSKVSRFWCRVGIGCDAFRNSATCLDIVNGLNKNASSKETRIAVEAERIPCTENSHVDDFFAF